MKIPVLNIDGVSISDFDFEFLIDPAKYKFEHIAYLVRKQQQAALRQGTHSTRTRGGVSGGGSKPYKQKGTGKARRGSNRTPLRVGGGVTFGPKPRDYAFPLNKKVVRLGYKLAVSAKSADLVVLEPASLEGPSTRSFINFIKNIRPSAKSVLLVGSGLDLEEAVFKSARNLVGVVCVESSWIPLEALVRSDLVVMTPNAIKELKGRLA